MLMFLCVYVVTVFECVFESRMKANGPGRAQDLVLVTVHRYPGPGLLFKVFPSRCLDSVLDPSPEFLSP